MTKDPEVLCTLRELELGRCICVKCGTKYPSQNCDNVLANCSVVGWGDKVAKVIKKATGIKPCGGCGRRKKALNKLGGKH